MLLLVVFTGWIGLLGAALGWRKSEREWGKDVIFELPLRVCEACCEELTTASAVKEAMREVPLYRRLLLKYPNVLVALPARAGKA
jgi:hypothetical protein